MARRRPRRWRRPVPWRRPVRLHPWPRAERWTAVTTIRRMTRVPGAAVALLVAALALGGCGTPRPRVADRPASQPTQPTRPASVVFDTPEGFVADLDYRILVPLHPVRESQ